MLPALMLLLASFPAWALEKPVGPALKADEAWLTLTDNAQYPKSWERASAALQRATGQQKWDTALESVRSPLGKVEVRKLKSAVYATTLPGAPDGEYVVAQFETSFEHKRAAVETVTASLDKDGVWRVSGYFIR